MDTVMFGYVAVALLGLVLGSFAGASVWRLRAWQLKSDKAAGEEVDTHEYKRLKPLTSKKLTNDRSRCLQCQHELKWYDLVPLASWISTKGTCRYCHASIGKFEPLIELGTSLLLVLYYQYWLTAYGVGAWIPLIIGIIVIVMVVILFAYDAKWFLLPDAIVFPLIAIGLGVAVATIITSNSPEIALISTIGAILILSGLYLGLWLVSAGQWIGFGDVKLGLVLALLLSDFLLAFLTLFLANLLGVVIVLPGLMTKKITRKSHVPFGPLLIVGFFISLFYGHQLIDAYLQFATTLML